MPARTEPLARYQALPVPTVQDEHWRFTDLAGFDPDAWTGTSVASAATGTSLLDLDVGAVATVGTGSA